MCHEMPVCELGVTNTKTSQDHLSVSGPLCGGTPSDHVGRILNDKIAKRVYVGEWAGSHSVGRSQKRWIETMKDCWKKRGLDVRQARTIVHDRSVLWGLVRGNEQGIALDLDEMPQPYEALEGWKYICGQAHNLRM